MKETERMQRLLSAFGSYIAQSREFDIAYTEKSGFIRLIVAEDADQIFFPIGTFDQMLEMFFYELLCDHVHPDQTAVDFAGFTESAKEYLYQLDSDRENALEQLDNYVDRWKRSRYLP